MSWIAGVIHHPKSEGTDPARFVHIESIDVQQNTIHLCSLARLTAMHRVADANLKIDTTKMPICMMHARASFHHIVLALLQLRMTHVGSWIQTEINQ